MFARTKLKQLAARFLARRARKASEALNRHGKQKFRSLYVAKHNQLATELGRAPQSWRGR